MLRSSLAQVAQLVERVPEEDEVVGSSPTLSTYEKTATRPFFHMCSGRKALECLPVGLEQRTDVSCFP